MAAGSARVAMVTGACSGIGRATAAAFVRRGYTTALVDIDEGGASDLAGELGQAGQCDFFKCDVASDMSVHETVDSIVSRYGRLDAAFNAAGIAGSGGARVGESSLDDWNRVIAVDLTGVWLCMRYQIPEIVKSGGGSVVNCSSTAGIRGAATMAPYTAAKHGVVGLTKAIALEYAGLGVRVNCVCPASVDTPMFRRTLSPEVIEQLIAASPVGRLGQPEEIADTVLWLCDDSPGFLTGQAIAIDGGMTAR